MNKMMNQLDDMQEAMRVLHMEELAKRIPLFDPFIKHMVSIPDEHKFRKVRTRCIVQQVVTDVTNHFLTAPTSRPLCTTMFTQNVTGPSSWQDHTVDTDEGCMKTYTIGKLNAINQCNKNIVVGKTVVHCTSDDFLGSGCFRSAFKCRVVGVTEDGGITVNPPSAELMAKHWVLKISDRGSADQNWNEIQTYRGLRGTRFEKYLPVFADISACHSIMLVERVDSIKHLDLPQNVRECIRKVLVSNLPHHPGDLHSDNFGIRDDGTPVLIDLGFHNPQNYLQGV